MDFQTPLLCQVLNIDAFGWSLHCFFEDYCSSLLRSRDTKHWMAVHWDTGNRA